MLGPDTITSFLADAAQDPVLLVAAIIIATFILEDAATIAAALLAADGIVPVPLALGALLIGIILGDIGLYALGRLAARNSWVRRQLQRRAAVDLGRWMGKRIFPVVCSARFVPGARFPSYTASGMLGLSFWHFTLAAVIATSLWTILSFSVIFFLGNYFHEWLGPWRWLIGGLLVGGLLLFARVPRRHRTGYPTVKDTAG